MLKILILILAAIFAAGTTPAQAETPARVSIKGSWVGQTEDSAFSMKATVTKRTIKIWLVADDMTSLYWKGTVPKNAKVYDGGTFTSKGDTRAMAPALLGSDSKYKKFAVIDGKILFHMSIFGYRHAEELHRP